MIENLTAIRALLTRWPDAWQEYEHYDEAQDRHSLGSAIAYVTGNARNWVNTPEALALAAQLGVSDPRYRNGEPVLVVWASYPRRRIGHILDLINRTINEAHK